MSELKRDGVLLHYEVYDFTDPWLKPETVLLHHGCGKHSRFWYRWIPVLARKYRVVVIDARGFGQSSDPGPAYQWSLKGFADDVIAVIDHLGVDKFHFVGEYMGAWVGIELSLAYPQRLASLVFSAVPYFWTTAANMTDPIDNVGVKEWQLAEEPYRFGGDPVYGTWFAEEFARSRTEVVKSVIRAASAVDFRGRISEIQCPVLALLGELYVRKNNAEAAVEDMKRQLNDRSEVVVLKGGPMFAIYTMAEDCAARAAGFFERVREDRESKRK
ncbi:alpha/beta fold hydrolase [Bordetella petrii]|nr:alpha/beta fold hydrolase [Bordetella petrii]